MPLSVKDGMGAWIKDFQDSNAPQFKGKSDKERREMAMAAYLSAKRGDKKEATDNPPFTPDPPKPKQKNSDGTTSTPMSRAKQLAKMARDRGMKKEEVELDEGTGFNSYADMAKRAKAAGYDPKKDPNKGKPGYNSYADMAKRAAAAKKKNTKKEEVELEEMYASTTEPHKDGHRPKVVKTQPNGKTTMSYLGQHVYKSKEHARNAADHIAKGMRKGRASDSYIQDFARRHHKEHGMKESVELEEMKANAAYTKAAKDIKAYAAKSGGIDKKDMMNFAADLDLMGRAPNILQAGRILDRINKRFKGYDTDVRDRLSMYLKKHGLMESVNEAFYGTQAQRMMSPLQKARQDKEKADRDRDGKLKSTALPMKKKKEEVEEAGSPERYKMIKKAGDKYNKEKKKAERDAMKAMSKDKDMMGESNVSELKKSTLGSYVKKASQDAAAKAYRSAMDANAPAYNPDQRDRSGINYMKSVKRQKGIARATDKLTKEAKSFDQKFRDHLKFSMSKSPAVQAYMKKRRDDRDARHAKQDPAAVKKNYGPAVVPPGTAYNKARKKGMNPSAAADAVSGAFKNKAKRDGKLPK